jgi:hypothetical protein
MGALTDVQVKFLDDLGNGLKGVRELLDDYGLHWREFARWQSDAAFTEALNEVFAHLELVREVDVRIGATEALRRQRMCVGMSGDCYLTARQRAVGDGLWVKVRQLDPKFPRQYGRVGTRREISPIHPAHLKDAHEIVRRMEELRRAALEARAREKAAKALPAPDARALPAPEADAAPDAPRL